MTTRHSFLDDYSEGAHPEILRAMVETNLEQETGYGNDRFSREARERIRQRLGGVEADVWFVASGTLANTLAIASALRPHEAVIAPASGHIAMRETGAIEATGHKIITVPPVAGKLTPESIAAALQANSHYPHMARPRMVYLSNATEIGTLYTRAELQAISTLCRERGLLLLLDGARLAAALSAPGNDLTLPEIAALADIFWIGGTKSGALLGEAIVIPNAALRVDFDFHIKQRGGLLAKGRLLGLQFRELFREDDLYLTLAGHANAMARRLAAGIRAAGHDFLAETETNQVFPILPDALIARLKEAFDFYVWQAHDEGRSVVRLVTSWATQEEQVEAFLQTMRSAG